MHWLYTLWFGYFWPSLKGNGPEALTQTVAYGAIAILLWPAARRVIREEVNVAKGEVDRIEAEERKAVAWFKRVVLRRR